MGFAFSHLWCQLGVSSLCESDSSFLARFVSWKAALEGVDGYPLCIFWTLWQERIKIAFEGVDISINRMKSTFLSNLWSWVNMYCLERPRSLIDFLFWMGY